MQSVLAEVARCDDITEPFRVHATVYPESVLLISVEHSVGIVNRLRSRVAHVQPRREIRTAGWARVCCDRPERPVLAPAGSSAVLGPAHVYLNAVLNIVEPVSIL